MEAWIAAYRQRLAEDRALSDNTRQGYYGDLEDFADAMRRQSVGASGQLQPRHIQLYLHELRRQGKSAATMARRFVTIRGLCRFGVMERLIAHDPTLGIEAPRTEKKPASALSPEEVGLLLDASCAGEPSPPRLRDAAMLELLYASGIRVSELIALDIAHVREDLGLLHCISQGGKERIVPIGRLAVDKLRRYVTDGRPALLGAGDQEQALFVNRRGTRLTRQGCWKIIRGLARDAGIRGELTPHMLRRSFAVHLLQNGADVRAVQEMLGHASPQSTLVYRDAVRTKVKEEYDRAHPRAGSAPGV